MILYRCSVKGVGFGFGFGFGVLRLLTLLGILTLNLPNTASIEVRLHSHLIFLNETSRLAELGMHSDNVDVDLVNLFMICDDFDKNPYPGVYLGWLEKLVASEANGRSGSVYVCVYVRMCETALIS